LKVGNWYKVPGESGAEIEAQLCNGIVMEAQKQAYCVYRTRAGVSVNYTNTLTDDEIEAYKLHPATFFGIVDDNAARGQVKTVIDWFDFLFESYQYSSKEKLLEFLAGAPDHDELGKQSQRDLAITYCERMALQIHGQRAANTAA
jgi:hypothetical protein